MLNDKQRKIFKENFNNGGKFFKIEKDLYFMNRDSSILARFNNEEDKEYIENNYKIESSEYTDINDYFICDHSTPTFISTERIREHVKNNIFDASFLELNEIFDMSLIEEGLKMTSFKIWLGWKDREDKQQPINIYNKNINILVFPKIKMESKNE